MMMSSNRGCSRCGVSICFRDGPTNENGEIAHWFMKFKDTDVFANLFPDGTHETLLGCNSTNFPENVSEKYDVYCIDCFEELIVSGVLKLI